MDKYTIISPQKMSTNSYTKSASYVSLALFWQQSENSIKMLTSTHDTLANPKHHQCPHSSCSLISESGFQTRSAAVTRTKLNLASRSRTRTKLNVGSRSRSKRLELLKKKKKQYGQVYHNLSTKNVYKQLYKICILHFFCIILASI